MADRIEDKDRGWKRIKKMLAEWSLTKAGGPTVQVGVQGDQAKEQVKKNPSTKPSKKEGKKKKGKGGDFTNAKLAATHEFGTKDGKIPPRPFIRHTADSSQEKIAKELNDIVARDLDGKEKAEKGLGMLGETVRADILKTISSSPGAGGGPLKGWADSTKARKAKAGKAGDPVLQDTGELRNAITSKVVTK